MRLNMRIVIALSASFLAVGSSLAQQATLKESLREGDCYKVSIRTNLAGNLKVARNEKVIPIVVKASNEHDFVERVFAIDKSLIKKSVRYYETAKASAQIQNDSVDRTLRSDRRRVVAQRIGDGLLTYSPSGPMTQEELEVVSEHFDTLHLTGVLSDKESQVGDKWKIGNIPAQSLCLFDGLISQDLEATFESLNSGVALIRVKGSAKGIEKGAMVALNVEAALNFDTKIGRIVGVSWKQTDKRDQGPVSPAAEVETQTTLTRELVNQIPKELSDAALAGVPSQDDPPGVVKSLAFADSKARFRLIYSRDWHIVGQTEHYLVMRLLDRGDFVAQMTMTMWKNAGAGKHMSPEEFQKTVAEAPGWKMEKIVEQTEVPGDADRWCYRIIAQGELEGTKVTQNYYVIANMAGEQMIVTFTMKPSNASRLGTKDQAIVNAVEFLKK